MAARSGSRLERRYIVNCKYRAWCCSRACDTSKSVGYRYGQSGAGAMSMAAAEYVSVHSQEDTERADLDTEHEELKTDNKGEHKELAEIYIARELDPSLAKQVALQLMAHDALSAHDSEELGISKAKRPRPIQAALSSATSFALGALMPLLVTAIAPGKELILHLFIGVARTSGWAGCTCEWGWSDDRRNARGVLGRIGNGNDAGIGWLFGTVV